ncbi:MAG: GDSL-type esterase/lipase family protein [Ruthenibacterium sp.]
MSHRMCSFAVAHTDISAQPFNNAQRTVRIYVPNNLTGTGVRIQLANHYGTEPVWVGNATVALCDRRKGELIAGTIHPLTVHGEGSFAIVPGHEAMSDLVKLPVAPGDTLAVSLYYPSAAKVTSGNFVGVFAQRSVRGDYCETPLLPKARLWTDLSRSVLPWDISSAVTTVRQVVVQQADDAPRPRVIAAFGDSIMQQGAWLTPFATRLYKRFPGEVSVCNLGIGGNRLLHNSPAGVKGIYGLEGMTRYKCDVLGIEGLTHVIFALGTNDIGLPGKDGAPDSDLITLAEYQDAVTQLVADLRAHNLKVFGAKLLPREINHVYTPERELLRLNMNDWLDSCGLFDAVIDLGAPIADDTDGVGMKRGYSLPDRLHPNLAGGKLMADHIDLALFA